MKILLTNDDGYESCALIPTIEILEKMGNVEVIIPEYQQSWTSKANTRRKNDIALKEKDIGGKNIFTLDAFPSDCANFGLYKNDKLPDLLVSGANIGMNIGIGMFLSSGTIGAALEGLLAGVPSIAISCPYKQGQKLDAAGFETSLKSLPNLINAYLKSPKFAMLTLNLPLGIENNFYNAVLIDQYHFGSLFKKDENNLIQPRHYYELKSPEGKIEGTDAWAKMNQINSVVALNPLAQFIKKSIVHKWLLDNRLANESTNQT